MQTAEVDLQKLAEFLVEAKKKGYAGGGKYTETDDEFLTFEFESGDYLFQDKYQDGADKGKFFGFERTWQMPNRRPIHVMHYSGGITAVGRRLIESGYTTLEEIDTFLKERLLLVFPEEPFRGPTLATTHVLPPRKNRKFLYYARTRSLPQEENSLNRYGEEIIDALGVDPTGDTTVHSLHFVSRVLV